MLSFVAEQQQYHQHGVPWSVDICSNQHSPVRRVGMPCISNRYTHFLQPRNNTSVDLTTTTEVRALGRSAIKCRVVGEHCDSTWFHCGIGMLAKQ